MIPSLACPTLRTGMLAFVGMALVSCEKPKAVVPPPPFVEILEITTSDVALSTTLIGQLDASDNVEVRARVEGFVEEIPFTEGVEVKQGDVLFLIDKKPFIERLAAANGMLSESMAALRKYETDVARLKPLYEKNAIPKQDLDNAMASVEVGKAGVESSQARVESAQLDLSYCEIKAPTGGLIGASMVSRGELVGKGQPTLLATISSLDPVWFYCNVAEVDYLKAQERSKALNRKVEDLPLTLILANGTEHPEKGRFVFIDRAVDVKTGTLRVRAEFPNKEKTLRPGMFARVRVDMGTRKDCLEVPERAIVSLQSRSFVWVVNAEKQCSMRPVVAAEKHGANYLITEGLKAGERVIVEGVQKARDGLVVNAMTAAQYAAFKAAAQAEKKTPN